MDDYKLVMISIFGLKKNEKYSIFFLNMLGKILGFGCMQQNIFFSFLKMF
jgi:hypothetical protein